MIKLIVLLTLLLFSNINSFAEDHNESDVEKNFPVDFINRYSRALQICDEIGKAREDLSKEDIEALSSIKTKNLYDYLLYRNELSKNKCMEDNGSYPVIFLIHYMGDESKSKENKKIVENFLDLIASPSVYKATNFYKGLSEDEIKTLESIDYFKEPFNFVKIAQKIEDNKQILKDGASK